MVFLVGQDFVENRESARAMTLGRVNLGERHGRDRRLRRAPRSGRWRRSNDRGSIGQMQTALDHPGHRSRAIPKSPRTIRRSMGSLTERRRISSASSARVQDIGLLDAEPLGLAMRSLRLKPSRSRACI